MLLDRGAQLMELGTSAGSTRLVSLFFTNHTALSLLAFHCPTVYKCTQLTLSSVNARTAGAFNSSDDVGDGTCNFIPMV